MVKCSISVVVVYDCNYLIWLHRFEVSKTLWNLLLVNYMELNRYKARMFIALDTRKSSGRYRPYSNVDSFLKASSLKRWFLLESSYVHSRFFVVSGMQSFGIERRRSFLSIWCCGEERHSESMHLYSISIKKSQV